MKRRQKIKRILGLSLILILVSFMYSSIWRLVYPEVVRKGFQGGKTREERILSKVYNKLKNNESLGAELKQKLQSLNLSQEELKEKLEAYSKGGKKVDVGMGQAGSVVVTRSYRRYLMFSLPTRFSYYHYTFFGIVYSGFIFSLYQTLKGETILSSGMREKLDDWRVKLSLLVIGSFLLTLFLTPYISLPIIAGYFGYLFFKEKEKT